MVLVVKVGGRALMRNLRGVLKDLAEISRMCDIVLVHGGGDLVTEYSRRLGIEPKFVVSPSGIRSRYTSREELDVYVMVMAGKLNKEIVSTLKSFGVSAVGVSGADGDLLLAERKKRIIILDERGRKRVINGGFTGRVTSVNTDVIETLLKMGYVIVVAPVAVADDGTLLNVDGDQAACAIARAVRADELIFLTDVGGVLVNGEVVKEIKVRSIDELVKEVGFGMNRKLLMIKEVVESGVKKVVISSGLIDRPVMHALSGGGTVVRC